MKVLVVEDDDINQEVIRILLTNENHEVEVAGNGLLALRKIEKNDYDIILMDIQMPVMDGFEATRLIRERERKMDLNPVPIIAVTAYPTNLEERRLLEAGASDFISKPLKLEKLLSSMSKFIN